MLENCAQNSSFNSDSSIVQRVLNGETLKVSHIGNYISSTVFFYVLIMSNMYVTAKE